MYAIKVTKNEFSKIVPVSLACQIAIANGISKDEMLELSKHVGNVIERNGFVFELVRVTKDDAIELGECLICLLLNECLDDRDDSEKHDEELYHRGKRVMRG